MVGKNVLRKANGGLSDASSQSLKSSVAATWFIPVVNYLVFNDVKGQPSMTFVGSFMEAVKIYLMGMRKTLNG